MPHADILDRPESIGKPLVGSVVLHVALVTSLLLWGVVFSRHPADFGSPNSGGFGSVAINPVKTIPLPARGGIVNPLANDTESAVPTPPPAAKAQHQAKPEESDAIPIKGRSRHKTAQVERSAQNTWRAKQTDRTNQLYSEAGPALVSPMVGQAGSGGVGVGPSTPFGNRFGYYVDILKQRVAEKWHTGDVDARIRTAPPAIVVFDLQRDGSVRNVHIAQTSGNVALDFSAQRAIYDASPFPRLPDGYEHNDATVEFWFELRR